MKLDSHDLVLLLRAGAREDVPLAVEAKRLLHHSHHSTCSISDYVTLRSYNTRLVNNIIDADVCASAPRLCFRFLERWVTSLL